MNNALIYFLQTCFDFYLYLLIVRVVMQKLNAKFHSPFCLFVVKLTQPVVKPLQRFVPGFGGFDFAIIVLCILIQFIEIFVLSQLLGQGQASGLLLFSAVFVQLSFKLINVFFYSILIEVISSWLPMLGGSPNNYQFLDIFSLLSRPVLTPIRRWMPVFGGFDFSPIVGLFLLKVIELFIIGLPLPH